MVAGARDGHLEEVRIPQHRVGRREAAARMPEDPDAIEIDELVLRGELLDGRDVIGQPIIAEVAVVVVVKCLRAERRAEVIELDDDEPELGQREGLAAVLELPLANAADLRAGIDVVDDRILLRRVEPWRQIDQSIEIRHAVARLHGE